MDHLPAITLITDPAFSRHDTGGGEHPEVAERVQVITDRLDQSPLAGTLNRLPSRAALRSQLLSFHTEAWLFRFEEAVLSGRTYIDHPDNQVCYDSYEIATLAAGAGLVGIDAVEQRSSNAVFSLTRPPGHHAEPNMPFGFCFFNNCVIAARYWQRQYGRQRVCVFDFDAHHGNGIQTAFEEDPSTAYISIHEHPSFSYPGTGWAEEHGIGAGKGTILNLPLPPGAGEREVLRLLPKIRIFLEKFQPDALVIAAGFDAHREDDMSGLAFSVDLYRKLGTFIMDLARNHTQGRVMSILEGGYHLDKLGLCVEAYLIGILENTK
ncbi:histone deacetylase family protein [Desulfobulbus alkaliphilus]|uniref:histone deacetylase family protein n=1 Tax=Desulfobulbus alkaliphilus TaxID=869814 RepID=UPI001963DDE8|nr:histone deacetylase [Desulfobulbus alkaliphilus]MBM9536500.1 histone deacetylase [Desulfobulbus alkaliphilus]